MRLTNTSSIFGLVAAIAVTLPLAGQSLPISGRVLSIGATIAAVAVFVLPTTAKTRPTVAAVSMIAIAVLIAALVAASSSASQLAQLTFPSSWKGSGGPYYDSKLVMFMIAFLPCAAVAGLFAFVTETEEAALGWVWGLVAVAALCFVVLLLNWPHIARSEYVTSRAWFRGATRGAFSTISFGLALSFAGLSAWGLLRSAGKRNFAISAVSGLMLFGVFWLNRRGDVILYCVALLGLGTLWAVTWRRPTALTASAASLVIAAILAAALGNASNWIYWGHLGQSASHRVALAGGAELPKQPPAQVVATKGPPPTTLEALPTVEAPSWLLGDGLGTFALDNTLLYPHNVLVELVQESGVIAAALYLSVVAILLVTGLHALLRRRLTPLSAALIATASVAYAGTLKTGDISGLGLVTALSIVAVVTTTSSNRPI